MANQNTMAIRPYHLNPDEIVFSLFTEEELRKLCLVKIRTPITFDALGYSLAEGLYDKAMGPLNKDENCSTCFLNIYKCPGHFGIIDLPLPVVNPLFHKLIATILRISCLKCFRIQLPKHIKHIMAIQIRLLNCGLVTDAIDVGQKIEELVMQYETFENIPEDAVLPIQEYDKVADNAADELKGKIVTNKNTEALRNHFVEKLVKNIKSAKVCIHCRSPKTKIQSLKNKIILNVVNKGAKEDRDGTIKTLESKFLTPSESRGYLRSIWEVEQELILQLVPVLSQIKTDCPIDVLYFDIIPVTPNNVRPVSFVAGRMTGEHASTRLYKNILQTCMTLRMVMKMVQNDETIDNLSSDAKAVYNLSRGSNTLEKLSYAWEDLQSHVNNLMDKEASIQGGNEEGLKQLIEKKGGIIRKHMMGKRVNYAGRSVITPDPYINVDEIGVPEAFAMRLTYPVPVTSWNIEELRKMIRNGPNVHPGAVLVEFENGMIQKLNENNLEIRESIIKRLGIGDRKEAFKGVKRVHRHLCNGDILLLNRQPTLHKPSIMAHTARVLKGERTLRLHYANCKAYNADFDGDEMNAHFPQNELARSEGYLLANVSNQYLVPKDGTPLSGLIQDHMISGVRLSVRGQFFTRNDYQQLVFQALADQTSNIKLLPPAILKPRPYWSGKQILSTVIINIIPDGKVPINLTATSKISEKAWVTLPPRKWLAGGTPFTRLNEMSEAEVIIRGGELLVGVLDKTHYGATPYGLIHCMYELYGGSHSSRLLSALGRLFTTHLQQIGFTLGVSDILVKKFADRKRAAIINRCRREVGQKAITRALDIDPGSDLVEIVDELERQCRDAEQRTRANVDRAYKEVVDEYTNEINKVCLPAGLITPFPANNLQLMVQSGAKGSTVNTMQISCLLGQIELEGKRPPVMISGRSLPSFPVSEFAPRAGGFIDGRFMTGIQPQEFFFHCMAGREGLIDTAVKTSRSGYLQRCLIKHLEGLTVGYDLTVRDSDRSVIQFIYGEDGMDISKSQFLNKKQLAFLSENAQAVADIDQMKSLQRDSDYKKVNRYIKKVSLWKAANPKSATGTRNRKTPFTEFAEKVIGRIDLKNPKKLIENTGRTRISKFIVDLWHDSDEDIRNNFRKDNLTCPPPVSSIYQPDCHLGALNEHLVDIVDKYNKDIPSKKERKHFLEIIQFKAMQSMCHPGEPVGLLAAQSIGEPSTQMTLNTFHFAGRGDMNVTLGIPRLREILMMASKRIKTPSMEVPFLDHVKESKANKLCIRLTRVTLDQVLEIVNVKKSLETDSVRQRNYVLTFKFLPEHLYKKKYYVNPKFVLKYMQDKYFKDLFHTIRKYAKIKSNLVTHDSPTKSRKKKSNDDVDDDNGETDFAEPNANDSINKSRDEDSDGSSEEEPEDGEDAKMAAKHQGKQEDGEQKDEDKNEEEHEVESDQEENQDDISTTLHESKTNVEEAVDDPKPRGSISIDPNIIASVITKNAHVTNYRYDTANYLWCELTFALPINYRNLDMSAIVRETAERAVVWERRNIRRAIVYRKDDKLTLRTDGINLTEMFRYHDLLDLNRLYCNEIHGFAQTYGIEAAAKVIVKEVREVFSVYGITVDSRHLALIADYMTFNGAFEPLSRKGLECGASPLQQMSFEASLTFLRAATIRGRSDQLRSPSSCLMLGVPCHSGTGAFALRHKLTGS